MKAVNDINCFINNSYLTFNLIASKNTPKVVLMLIIYLYFKQKNMFYSTNPYTGKQIAAYDYDTTQSLKNKLEACDEAFSVWSSLNVNERALQIKSIGEVLNKYKGEAAKVMTEEMGKPISESIAEVEKCITLCDYYTRVGPDFLNDKNIKTSVKESYVTYAPIGVILGIMPWNFPFWQVFRFIIPTLLAGNSVVIKHALNVPASALLIEKIINEALSVENAYVNLFAKNRVTEHTIANKIIKGVSLTGSVKAGKAVAAAAGKVLKPVVLELGGSNALIIFEDADIESSAEACIKSRFQNNGQSCIAGKRLLVHEKIQTKFIEVLLDKVRALKVGDPTHSDTQISVLAKREFVMDLEQQLDISVDEGALILIGGNNKSYSFEPTVLRDVTPDMAIFKEETFGPVLSVTTFKDEKEAIELANNTEFGLGVSLFSKDTDRMKSLVTKFNDGAVFINSFVKSIPELPFGGSKNSGIGRELAEEGLKAFVNIKTVVVE